jgi:hypothetical protein
MDVRFGAVSGRQDRQDIRPFCAKLGSRSHYLVRALAAQSTNLARLGLELIWVCEIGINWGPAISS